MIMLLFIIIEQILARESIEVNKQELLSVWRNNHKFSETKIEKFSDLIEAQIAYIRDPQNKRLWTIEDGVCIVGARYWSFGEIANYFDQLSPHYQARIAVDLYLFNVSNDGKVGIYLDDKLLKQYQYNQNQLVVTSFGPTNIFKFNDTFAHQISSINLKFKCDLNQDLKFSSCGYSSLRIFIDECSTECLFCTGPEVQDCLKCNKNKVSTNQSCQILSNSRQNKCASSQFSDSFGLCQQCEQLKFNAQLLKNLTSMVLISNQNFFYNSANTSCVQIFQQQTVDLLGLHAFCSVLNSTHLLVSFGDQFTLNISTPIEMKKDYLQSLNANCSNLLFTQVESSTLNRDYIKDGAAPYIIFSNQTEIIDICSINSLNFTYFNNIDKQLTFDLQLVNLDSGKIETSPIIQENQLIFQQLQPSTHYNLMMNMTNVLGIQNQQSLIFTTSDPYKLVVQILNISDQLPYYRYQQFQLRGQIQLIDCTTNLTLNNKIINYTWIQSPNQTYNNLSGIINSFITTPKSLVIQPFILEIHQNYTFILMAQYENQISSDQVSMIVELADLFVFIEGGNRVNSFFDSLLLKADFVNPNFDSVFNNTLISYEWSCISQLTNQTCRDSRYQPIIFNNSEFQYFPPSIFQITDSITFTVKVSAQMGQYNLLSNQGLAVIMITEVSIQPLSINIPLKVQVDRVSLNERLDFSINNTNITDTLSISVGILYNFKQISQIFFNYPSFQIRLWNYISIDTLDNPNLFLKIMVTSPNNQPQMQLIHLNINFPPNNCVANILPEIGYELDTQFQIFINNCTDSDNGFNYRIVFFEDFNAYNESFYDSTFQKKVVLQDFSSTNNLLTILPSPQNQDPLLPKTSYIQVSISDFKGAIKNITLTVTVLKKLLNNTTIVTVPQSQSILANYLIVQSQSTQLDPIKVYQKTEGLLNEELPQYSRNQIFSTLYLIENSSLVNFSTDTLESSINRINCELDRIQNQVNNVKDISLVSDSDDTPDNQQQNILNSIETHLVGISQYLQVINQGTLDENSSNYTELSVLNLQLVKQIDKIWNLSLLTLDPNQKRQFLLEKSFKMISLFGSKEFIEQSLGPVLTDRKLNIFDQSNHRRLTTDFKSNQYYVKSVQYLKNPYYLDFGFPKNNTDNTVIDIAIKAVKRTDINILDAVILNQDINLFFNVKAYQYQYNITRYCSQRQDDFSWSSSDCVLIQKPSNTSEIQCSCSKLNPTTVIAYKLENLFTSNSFEVLKDFNFTNTIIYWMILILILYFSVLTVYGWKQDEIDQRNFRKEQKKFTTIISQIPEDHLEQQKENKSLQEINDNDEEIQLRTTKHTMTILPRERHPKLSINQATIFLKPKDIFPNEKIFDRKTEKKRQKQKRITDPKLIKLRELQRETALYGRIQNEEISVKLALVLFIFKAHKMSGIITTYDPQKPRATRSVLYFQQILNILAITFFFGYEVSVARSLVLIIFGTIVTRILYFFIDKSLFSQQAWLQKVGRFLIYTSLGVDIYIVLGSIVLYANQSVANAWAQNYINWFGIDLLFIDPLTLTIQFVVLHKGKTIQNRCYYRLVKLFINSQGRLVYYGYKKI